MRTIRKKSGFTLLEAVITVGILSIVSVGIFNLMRDGLYLWQSGSARLAIESEARIAMAVIKKIVQQCQGTSLSISRIDSQNPVNSYLSAVLTETLFVKTTQQRCGCGSGSSDPITVGGTGAHVEIFQKDHYLLVVFPEVLPGTDLGDSSAVEQNTYYKTLTLSANVESLMFTFNDSKKGTVISAAARFSKRFYENRPPAKVLLKETAIIKRMHSAGYYYN